jgi:putative DNA methylase
VQIDTNFPLNQLNELARMESYNKHYYRPPNYLHKWWARRLGSVFRTIILGTFLEGDQDVWEAYYRRVDFGDRIVLDPFMGGGTTVVEALRLGCKIVGVDLNPVAWWTVKKAIEPVSLDALDRAFRQIEQKVAPRIQQFYKTRCLDCQREADVLYFFWVKKAPCLACGQETRLHTSHVITHYKDGSVVFCPACGHVFKAASTRKDISCPICDQRFTPSQGMVLRSSFTCLSCGQKQTIIEATRQRDKPLSQEMYALSYFCPVHGQGFKSPDDEDKELYRQAARQFGQRKESLLFPRQAIPDGLKTGDLLNHNYQYWHELFNERQLLCLDMLLRAIIELKDENVREFMLTLFSSCLEFNNMFCSYKGTSRVKPGAVRHIFSHHAFVLPREPLENNLWGVNNSSGSFSSLYRSRLRRGKEYCLAPVERLVKDGRVVQKVRIKGEKIEGRLAASFAELQGGQKNALLLCQNSEALDLPDKSVDAVITDPPYFDNVQYSELADFFYVWLRMGLKDKYAVFQPALGPKTDEVVKNPKRGKNSESFLEGLINVFRECHRVLKDDGALIFTFHHKESEAWSIVLKAVLDAGFYIDATYPVHAEMKISVHIHNQEAIEYDAIIVCHKRTTEASATWDELEDQIRARAEETLLQLTEANGAISKVDTSVIVLGKCLEFYSRCYPNVTQDGRSVTIKEAVESMQHIVNELAAMELPSRVHEDHAKVRQLRLLEEETAYEEGEP